MKPAYLALVLTTTVLAACGGGSSGSDNTGNDNGDNNNGGTNGGLTLISYSGNTADAPLNANTAVRLSTQALLRSSGLTEILNVHDYIAGLDTVNSKLTCNTGDVDVAQVGTSMEYVKLTWTFNNCDTGAYGQVVNGTLIREAVTSSTSYTLKEVYQGLSINAAGHTYSFDGSHVSSCPDLSQPANCVDETVLRDGNTTYKFGNIDLSPHAPEDMYPYRPLAAQGSYCDPTEGCMTIRIDALGYPDTCGGLPSDGAITLTGANGSSASLVANIGCTISVSWDDASGGANAIGGVDAVAWP